MARTKWTPPETQAEKVLSAALRLFDAHGYSAATIEDIRLQSDVSIGTIYHYFGNKEGIAGALYERALRALKSGLNEALSSNREAEAGVRAGIGSYLRWVDQNHAAARFLWRRRETEVVRRHRAEIRALDGEAVELIELWCRPLIDARQIKDLPVPLLRAIWFGPAERYARSALDGGRPWPLIESEHDLGDAAWAALRSSR